MVCLGANGCTEWTTGPSEQNPVYFEASVARETAGRGSEMLLWNQKAALSSGIPAQGVGTECVSVCLSVAFPEPSLAENVLQSHTTQWPSRLGLQREYSTPVVKPVPAAPGGLSGEPSCRGGDFFRGPCTPSLCHGQEWGKKGRKQPVQIILWLVGGD